MSERIKNSLVLLLALVLSLVACEAGMRLWSGVPLLEIANFRERQVIENSLVGLAEYDPALGWRLKSNASSPMFHTKDYGIRKNGPEDNRVRTGGILAAGASFTAGSQVDDVGAWPAQLETLIGQPVLNGGVGGYGADQIIMRAEELLPLVAPKILVVDLLVDNITTAGYSYFGYPKPYFTIEDDKFVLNNSPVPRYILPDKKLSFSKHVLSYSFVFDRIMAAYFRDYWYSSTGKVFDRAQNDEVEVTCKLLQRLKKAANERNIRTLMSVQHGGDYVIHAQTPAGPMLLVEECARSIGFQVVDEFAYLKGVLESDPAEFARHYVIEENGLYGHKSAYGNGQVARIIARALDQPTLDGDGTYSWGETPESAEEVSGIGENLLENAERLDAMVAGSEIVSADPASGDPTPRAFKIAAIGGMSEHYGAFHYSSGMAGQVVLSLDARAKDTSNVRIQLLDSAQNGAYGDFDLDTGKFSTTRLGLSRQNDGGMTPIGDDWYRLWVTARLPNAGGVAIVQLGDGDANRVFNPGGESILVRAVTVQKGRIPNPYQHSIAAE